MDSGQREKVARDLSRITTTLPGIFYNILSQANEDGIDSGIVDPYHGSVPRLLKEGLLVFNDGRVKTTCAGRSYMKAYEALLNIKARQML